MSASLQSIEIKGDAPKEVLSKEALEFLKELHTAFEPKRQSLLQKRKIRQAELNKGQLPDFLKETEAVRKDKSWQVASIPADLQRRWVEITGPAEKKMIINALNSGADVFMADFEDALSPTWENVLNGQKSLSDAIDGRISFTSPEGKEYRLKPKTATLVVRPRGFHLVEKHLLIDHAPLSASLFDFGLFLFHNAKKLIQKGSGPYFYLPKLENHLEARLWNEIFLFAENYLQIPRGTIKATVLIETILAAFEMEEILYELREHITGLNAGRWDYTFSIIKKFATKGDFLFPDRSQIAMSVPFMRAYAELLVKTCHERGAHAMGGMAAFIPSRKHPDITENALIRVREDKVRESTQGFDGTWVAHPDLVQISREIFEKALQGQDHQKKRVKSDRIIKAEDLLRLHIPGGKITEEGFKSNVAVALQYITSWFNGQGAVAINFLMEDAATAEICRSQLWQWLHHKAVLENGEPVTKELFERCLADVNEPDQRSKEFLREIVLKEAFTEFLTLPAYEKYFL